MIAALPALVLLAVQLSTLWAAFTAWRRGQRRLAGFAALAHYAGTFGLVVVAGPRWLGDDGGRWMAAGLVYAAGMMMMVVSYGLWLSVRHRKDSDG
jgi:hypothetical protein